MAPLCSRPLLEGTPVMGPLPGLLSGAAGEGGVGHFCCCLHVGYHLQVKSSQSTAPVVELSPIFSPKLTLPLQTQRRLCVPALAGSPWPSGGSVCPGAADGLL